MNVPKRMASAQVVPFTLSGEEAGKVLEADRSSRCLLDKAGSRS